MHIMYICNVIVSDYDTFATLHYAGKGLRILNCTKMKNIHVHIFMNRQKYIFSIKLLLIFLIF